MEDADQVLTGVVDGKRDPHKVLGVDVVAQRRRLHVARRVERGHQTVSRGSR